MAIGDDDVDTMGLSEEEIAAMADDDGENEAIDEIIGEDDDADAEDAENDDSDDTDDDVDDPDPKEANKATNEAEVVADADEANDADEADTVVEQREFMPNLSIDRVEDYDEKMADITNKRQAVLEQMENGEIDLKEFIEKDRALGAVESELRSSKQIADNAEKQQLKLASAKWEWEQEQFFETPANKIYGENSLIYAAFNARVKELALLPENQNKSGSWFLKEADKEVRKLFSTANTSVTDNKKVVDIKNSRKPNLKEIPKTLGNLPAADTSDTGNDEFAYLDKLEGMEYEAALAQLSKDPAKEARYLRQA